MADALETSQLCNPYPVLTPARAATLSRTCPAPCFLLPPPPCPRRPRAAAAQAHHLRHGGGVGQVGGQGGDLKAQGTDPGGRRVQQRCTLDKLQRCGCQCGPAPPASRRLPALLPLQGLRAGRFAVRAPRHPLGAGRTAGPRQGGGTGAAAGARRQCCARPRTRSRRRPGGGVGAAAAHAALHLRPAATRVPPPGGPPVRAGGGEGAQQGGKGP